MKTSFETHGLIAHVPGIIPVCGEGEECCDLWLWLLLAAAEGPGGQPLIPLQVDQLQAGPLHTHSVQCMPYTDHQSWGSAFIFCGSGYSYKTFVKNCRMNTTGSVQ